MTERGTGKAQQRGSADRRPVRRGPNAGGARAPGGAAARLFVPLALIVCAVAVLGVLSSTSSDEAANSGSKSSDSSSSGARAGAGDSENGGDGDSVNTRDDAASGATGASGPTRATYKVKPGDSFAAIAERVGVDVDTLSALNPDVDPRALQPGQKLKLK